MFSNTAFIEESIKINNNTFLEKIVELDNKISMIGSIQVVQNEESVNSIEYKDKKEEGRRYIISVIEEIVRLLSTPIGSRVMRPEYGSELYKLRDREFNVEWRLMATKYTFVAINHHIERVRCRKVLFEVLGDGKLKMKLQLEAK